MQFAICSAISSAVPAAMALEQQGLQWLKFGDDIFCYSPDAAIDWEKVKIAGVNVKPAARGAAQPRPGSLYLVNQEGRSFQRTHPDVSVLFDKGRHLLVSLEPQQARSIVPRSAHFSIRPVVKNEVVVERLARPAMAPPVVDRIKRVVDALSRTSFQATLTSLVSLPTRHSLSPQFRQAAVDARDTLLSMGYQASLQDVPIPGGITLNVIADKRGLGSENRSVVIVTAHLDSINQESHSGQDPSAPAPGADDNASGSAGVLEIAKVLKHEPIDQDLRLILFGGEEQDLYGSKQYVAQLSLAERARIKSVVNMDMIGVVNTETPTVLLEGGDLVSRRMIAGLSSAAHAYTSLTVEESFRYDASDHAPFIDAGVPAVLTIEGNDRGNENNHDADDTLDHINYDLALAILRMNTAFIAGEIGV